ncbi:uncharacterized protein LOC126896738 isoform X2 [Daktulosphaira vitifoliae]|uniref:uncharacterized protein LOC126896738 isoform X2 n=1 Tax=Daktulosphaira vitifoliae TaxID=58002 RepID=UPI0021AA053C|nr:uncharacterized protein LOC126896738 isoform X2 [Daktulosphaira vitifoliae]
MKLFSLVFFSAVVFMVIHNGHYMSMSKASSSNNEKKGCYVNKPTRVKLEGCDHFACKECIANMKIGRQSCTYCFPKDEKQPDREPLVFENGPWMPKPGSNNFTMMYFFSFNVKLRRRGFKMSTFST